MKFLSVFMAAVLLAGSGICQPASCGMADRIESVLIEKYGERAVFIGVSAPDRLVEIWASITTGSWTVLTRKADAETVCVVASGEGWVAGSDFSVAQGDDT